MPPNPLMLAVIVVVPADNAVTTPVELTDATLEMEDAQVALALMFC
jgi:hypothetical protein